MMKEFTASKLGFYSLIGLIGIIIIRYGIIAPIINEEILKKLKLEPGTKLWNVWTDIPIPIYTKFHFFNVTNPNKVINGDKPIIQEIGPYVYQEKRMKIILKQNDDQISYRPRTTWFFRPDLSYGTENDKITLLNIPFVGVAKMAWELSKQPFVLTTLDDMLTEKGETIFQTNLVKDFLFDGIPITNYMELLSTPVTQMFGDDIKISERLLDGDYGFFDDLNGTAHEVWIVKTGINKISDFGKIISWNGKPKMDVWKDDKCDAIQGTDGSIFPPFSNQNTILNVFAPDMCRTLQLEYSRPSQYQGVPTLHYTLTPNTFGSLKDYPENKCYCKDSNEHCMKGGLIPIGKCQRGAPLFVSRPHFVDAHPDYKNGVVGLSTESKDYDSFIELEGNIGQVVKADFKFQMNLELQSYDAMPSFANVPNVMFPLIWLEQTATITDELLEPIKKFGKFLKIMNILTTILIVTSILCLVGSVIWKIKNNKGKLSIKTILC